MKEGFLILNGRCEIALVHSTIDSLSSPSYLFEYCVGVTVGTVV